MITALAASFDYKWLIWVGIGCNIIAQLLNRFEHINNAISDRLLKDIIAMKQNRYIDEGLLIHPEIDNKGVFNPVTSKVDYKGALTSVTSKIDNKGVFTSVPSNLKV